MEEHLDLCQYRRRGCVHLINLVTCYQIALSRRRCLKLLCWAQMRSFPRLRALDILLVASAIFVKFSTVFERYTHLTSFLTHIFRHLNPKFSPHTNQRTKNLSDVDLLQSAVRRLSISLAISAVDCIIEFCNRQPKLFNTDCPYANDFPSRLKTPIQAC